MAEVNSAGINTSCVMPKRLLIDYQADPVCFDGCDLLCLQNTQKEGERKQLLGSEQNYYKQLYLENSGQPGDLRISEVTFGDPAAQGSVFVHERI